MIDEVNTWTNAPTIVAICQAAACIQRCLLSIAAMQQDAKTLLLAEYITLSLNTWRACSYQLLVQPRCSPVSLLPAVDTNLHKHKPLAETMSPCESVTQSTLTLMAHEDQEVKCFV